MEFGIIHRFYLLFYVAQRTAVLRYPHTHRPEAHATPIKLIGSSLLYLRGRINVLRGQMCDAETVQNTSKSVWEAQQHVRSTQDSVHISLAACSRQKSFPATLTDSRIHTGRAESREFTLTVYYVVRIQSDFVQSPEFIPAA